jgi:metacaspase-1
MISFDKGYALIIAIANYTKVHKLPETILKDGQDIFDLLCSSSCGYSINNAQLLLDQQANKEEICKGLVELASKASIGDTVIIFFSGHGGQIEINNQVYRYLIPYDCDPDNIDSTAISGNELSELILNICAQRLLVFFDCCYSGGLGSFKKLSSQLTNFKSLDTNYYEQLAQGTGRVIMASSRPDEVSLVLPGMKNSLFTSCLLEALHGKAHTRKDGMIRVLDVFDYVSENVPAFASQHPILKATDLENNFPIALYEGGKKSITENRYTVINKQHLREVMTEIFNIEEIDILCKDIQQSLSNDGITLQVSLDMVGGKMKEGKILELIEYLERRGYLAYLVQAVRRHRSGII